MSSRAFAYRIVAASVAFALLAACGNSAVADLEAENAALRQQLVDATSLADEPPEPTTPSTNLATTTSTTETTTKTTVPLETTATTSAPDTVNDDGTVTVASVTDGDTLVVVVAGAEEPLRLIGINTPEGGECLADEAASRLTELVAGGSIRLSSDVSDRDQYGRLLRYVYVGDVFVNEVLVREGWAIARRYEPDTAMADRLDAAQAAAQTDGVGMWASDACGQSAAQVPEIGHIRYDAAGNDNNNLNDEWVELTNAGSGSLDLTGWAVKDESASHRYHFPAGFTLAAGATVRLHTGCGTDTATTLFWCNQGSAVWNNSGDTVFLLDPNGNVVASQSYTG